MYIKIVSVFFLFIILGFFSHNLVYGQNSTTITGKVISGANGPINIPMNNLIVTHAYPPQNISVSDSTFKGKYENIINLTNINPGNNPVPLEYKLWQNYPNPFNPNTNILFYIAKPENIKITIYNILGQKVKTLTEQKYGSGSHNISWNGINDNGELVSSGIYLYLMETDNYQAMNKMVL